MRCPVCSYDNPANARFCNQCGTDLSLVGPHDAEPSFYDRIHDRDRYSTANVTQSFGAADANAARSFAADAAVTQAFGSPDPSGATRPFGAADQATTQAFDVPDPAASTVPLDGMQPAAYATAAVPTADRAPHEAQGARFAADDVAKGRKGRLPSMPSIDKRRARIIAIVVAVALCILVAAAAVITYSLQLWGGKVVPDVAGATQQAATERLEEAGFSVNVEEERSDEVQGTVLSCDPSAGLRVEPGAQITLKVAVARTIPDIMGKSQEEARAALEQEGLTNVTFEFVKSDDAEDSVLSVSPDIGSSVLSTTAITVTVAQPYTVPDVTGKMQEEAQKLVEEAGFVAAVVRVNDEEKEEGFVLSTDPAPGERAMSGTAVTIAVAHHRSAEAIELTRKFLTESKEMTVNGQACVVDEVKSITYAGDNVCEFSIVIRPYETHTWMFGWGTETRYGNPETITGKITWNDADDIVSVEPSMKQGA